MPEGTATQGLDNSIPATGPAVSPEPTPATNGQGSIPDVSPGHRDLGILNQLLEGADPTTLFNPPAQPTPGSAPPTAPAQGLPPEGQQPQPDPAWKAYEAQIPEKFKTAEDPITAMSQGYSEAEKRISSQGQEIGELRRQLEALRTQQDQPPTPAPEPKPSPPAPKQLTPEEKEALQNKYFEDPVGFMEEMLSKRVEDMLNSRLNEVVPQIAEPLKPIVEQYQHQQAVAKFNSDLETFGQDHPDLPEVLPIMQQLGAQYGREIDNWSNPIEILYNMAKGSRPAPEPQKLTVDEMLADPAALAKIMEHPEIKNKLRQDYVAEVKAGAPPTVIGAQPGGAPPATPAERPRSAREAGALASQWLRSLGTS